MQAYFRPGGIGDVDAGGEGAGSFTFAYDTWNNVSFSIDLDEDYAEMYFNDEFVISWIWSGGSFGTGTLNEFNAMNLYAWNEDGTPGAYFDNISIVMEAPERSSRDAFVGANLYRDGLMIAEMLQDTFYLDQDLEAGYFDYCINYIYESGAASCDLCVEVFVGEDCVAPEDLTATVEVEGTDSFVNLLWDQNSVAEWIYYDDGTNVDGIGGPETFTWAIKFDPDQLTELDGGALTKISVYNRTGAVNVLQIFEGWIYMGTFN